MWTQNACKFQSLIYAFECWANVNTNTRKYSTISFEIVNVTISKTRSIWKIKIPATNLPSLQTWREINSWFFASFSIDHDCVAIPKVCARKKHKSVFQTAENNSLMLRLNVACPATIKQSRKSEKSLNRRELLQRLTNVEEVEKKAMRRYFSIQISHVKLKSQ